MNRDELRAVFARNIQLRRACLGMTQIELAKAVDIPVGSVSAYERGNKLPSVDAAYRIASVLGVSLNDMFVPITIKLVATRNNNGGDAP